MTVILDADVIATAPLTPLLLAASAGRVAAFADDLADRFHPEWETLLGRPTVRQAPYVNSGVLVLPVRRAGHLLEAVRDGQRRIDVSRSRPFGAGSTADPFFYPDQDVWNAVLMADVEADDLAAFAHRLAPFPPFPGLTAVDPRTLTAGTAREPTLLLHHIEDKPWLARTVPNVYSRLLPRLLLADDVALRLEPRDLPDPAPARREWASRPPGLSAGLARGRLAARRGLAALRAPTAARGT